ncbi:MAG: hypothetical protein DME05_13855 [Candidatus Rokuibacteriota bacterium]|nr:MAG: hypothetical protein DME05_13855 [Candidatus Rokubacteria bacterium]
MSWNDEIVIDLDSHIVERADRFYQDYIDPRYREAYQPGLSVTARRKLLGQNALRLCPRLK